MFKGQYNDSFDNFFNDDLMGNPFQQTSRHGLIDDGSGDQQPAKNLFGEMDIFKENPFGNLSTYNEFGGFGDSFGNLNDALKVDEQDDHYIVLMRDNDGLEGKEFKVDFSKDSNQLTVTMIKETNNGGNISKSSSQNSVGFDKSVNYTNIQSSIENDQLIIKVQKADSSFKLEHNDNNYIEGIATKNFDQDQTQIEDVGDDDDAVQHDIREVKD